MPLIHTACRNGEMDTLSELVEVKGIDPCMVDKVSEDNIKCGVPVKCMYDTQSNGRHPIHIAASMGRKLMVKMLVEKYNAKSDCSDFVSASAINLGCIIHDNRIMLIDFPSGWVSAPTSGCYQQPY